MKIRGREISHSQPPHVIAELGVNHNGSVERALELTAAAAAAGADAVKLQHFEAHRLLSRAARLADYQRRAGAADPFEMLRSLELSVDEMRLVVKAAHDRGLAAIVTVFSLELVAPAAALEWDAYKIASPDIINRPLIEAMMATKKPLILSTGASTIEEVDQAVSWLGDHPFCLMQCVSSYPTKVSDAALGGIELLSRRFEDIAIGYSDHLIGEQSGAWAVSAGAVMLEKHLTYDTQAAGPDHLCSLDPQMLKGYAAMAREAAMCAAHGQTAPERDRLDAPLEARGRIEKRVLPCEREVRAISRQSLTTARPLAAGTVIGRDDLTIKRPGTGLSPALLDAVIGRRTAREVEADMPLMQDDLA